MAHGNGCSIKQLKEDRANPFGAKVETLHVLAGSGSVSITIACIAWHVPEAHFGGGFKPSNRHHLFLPTTAVETGGGQPAKMPNVAWHVAWSVAFESP